MHPTLCHQEKSMAWCRTKKRGENKKNQGWDLNNLFLCFCYTQFTSLYTQYAGALFFSLWFHCFCIFLVGSSDLQRAGKNLKNNYNIRFLETAAQWSSRILKRACLLTSFLPWHWIWLFTLFSHYQLCLNLHRSLFVSKRSTVALCQRRMLL